MVEKHITERLVGVTNAIVAPMTEQGEISLPLLEKQAAYLSESGVNGILVNGSTGEGPYILVEEKKDVFQTVRHTVSDDVLIFSACLQPSTTQAIAEIKSYGSNLPDFFVAVTPFYGGFTQKEIIEHYKCIAKESPVPILLYNIPKCTNTEISRETLLELSQVKNIAGMKDSSGDFLSFSRSLYGDLHENFTLFQGEDYLTAAAYSIGATATVNGIGNIFIEPYVNLYNASKRNDREAMKKYQKEINSVLEIIQIPGVGVIPAIKAATSLLGRGSRWTRMHFQAASKSQLTEIEKILGTLEISSVC